MIAVRPGRDAKPLTVPCTMCRTPVPLKVTPEPARGGSVKFELDCPKCRAYKMVRILPYEVPSLRSVTIAGVTVAVNLEAR